MRPCARIGVTLWSSNPRRKESNYRIHQLCQDAPYGMCPAWIQLRAIPVEVELQVVHRRGLRTGKGNTLGDVPTIDHRPMRDYPQPSGPSHYGTKPCEPLSA